MSATEILDAEIVIPELEAEIGEIILKSNFPTFKKALMDKIASYNTTLETEEQFAQAKLDEKELQGIRKSCKKAATLLMEKAGVLTELLDGISDSDEAAKVQAKKLKDSIASERERIKGEILEKAFAVHSSFTPAHKSRIEAAMKGKRTLETLESSASKEAQKIFREITSIDEVLESYDETLRRGRTAFLDQSLDAVKAEMERRETERQTIIREAELKAKTEAAEKEAEALRVAAIEKQQAERQEEKARQEEEKKESSKPPKQEIYAPKIDSIEVSSKAVSLDFQVERDAALAMGPEVFGQFRSHRLAVKDERIFTILEDCAKGISALWRTAAQQIKTLEEKQNEDS